MSTLHCALCLLTRNGIADKAATTINGTAVCYPHAKDMASGDFARVLDWLRSKEGR